MTSMKSIFRYYQVVRIGKRMHRIRGLMTTWCGREIKGDRIIQTGVGSCRRCIHLSSPGGKA